MKRSFGICSIANLPVPRKKRKQPDANSLELKINAEFTCAAHRAAIFRKCLGENAKRFADRHFSSRTTALTRNIVSAGPGAVGERSFEVLSHAEVFKHFELNKLKKFSSSFRAHYTFRVNNDRNTATLEVPCFRSERQVKPPKGAWGFKLILVVGVLSDAEYVGGPNVYAIVDKDIDGCSTVVESELMAIGYQPIDAFELVASIEGLPVLSDTAGLVVSVGIEFYRLTNNQEELLAGGRGMRVIGVF